MGADVTQLLNAATSALRAGNGAEARRIGRKALKQAPTLPAALLVCGLAERACGEPARAVRLLREAARREPGVAVIHQHLGVTLGMAGDWPAAADALGTLVRLAPREPAAHRLLGIAQQHAGQPEAALTALSRALELAPHDQEARLAMAGVLTALGEFDEAVEAYQAVLAQVPGHPSAGRALAHLLNKIGRFAEAVPLHRRELAGRPDDVDVIFELAYALAVTDAAPEAVDLLRATLERHPDNIPLRELLALAHMRAGDPAACIATSDSVLAKVPDNTSALAYKSMALNELGRREEAAFLIDTERLVHAVEFAPPVGHDSIEAFNAALIDAILKHPSLSYNPLNRSLSRGRSTGELFDAPDGVIAGFRTMVDAAVASYIHAHPLDRSHPWLQRRPVTWRIGCWANIMDRDGFHDVHFHPPGWLSGVYYPEVPAVVDDPDADGQGWIEFGRAYYQFRSLDQPPVRRIRPRAGLFVLFPSWFGHRTIPVRSEARRISVAFDVMPEGSARLVAGQEE